MIACDRGLRVDLAFGVAHGRDFVGQLAAEVIAVRRPDHAHAADRRAGQPRELRDQRIGLGPAAEEHDVDALRGVLVDQQRDILAALQRAPELERRIEA